MLRLTGRPVSRSWLSTALATCAPLMVVAATAMGRDVVDSKRNADVVRAFYEAALNRKDFDSAARYFGSPYIQHNPHAEDGIEGFHDFIAYLKLNHPNSHWDIKRILVDGDYVIVHTHEVLEPHDRGSAVIDLFRLDHGRIVEHWDVVQPIPAESANSNTMF
jgi:predicted SnoaL-like aldol condensation-catalyzing enzyme